MAPVASSRATNAIAIVTVAAFVLALIAARPQLVLEGGFIPARLSGFPLGLPAVPAWLTPLSATLLHGGGIHLGFNVLMLVFCGRQVEAVIGSVRLVLLYLAGAYGAAFAQYLVDPASPAPMIGASGAVSAVLATYALVYGRGTVSAIGPLSSAAVRALWLAVTWIAIQFGVSLASAAGPVGIATAAHVGGFLVGLALTRPLLATRYRLAQ